MLFNKNLLKTFILDIIKELERIKNSESNIKT